MILVLVITSLALVAAGLALAGAQPDDPFVAPPGFGAGPVTASTPVTGEWAEAVDGLGPGLDPTSTNSCRQGDPACLDAVIIEMETRLDQLGCAPTAPFAFTYLEMTRGVQARTSVPGFFTDNASLDLLDALFAQLYFDAFDNWAAARTDEVPGAWQMAFAAGESGTTSPTTDLLLGMNAHISRDLAYVVAAVLEAGTDGATLDRGDYDLVNLVIEEVSGPMLEGSAARFDPSVADLDLALEGHDLAAVAAEVSLDTVESAELIALWRNEALAMGERLAAATTPAERLDAEAEIERNAVAIATLILNADAAIGLGLRGEERNAYCERVSSER